MEIVIAKQYEFLPVWKEDGDVVGIKDRHWKATTSYSSGVSGLIAFEDGKFLYSHPIEYKLPPKWAIDRYAASGSRDAFRSTFVRQIARAEDLTVDPTPIRQAVEKAVRPFGNVSVLRASRVTEAVYEQGDDRFDEYMASQHYSIVGWKVELSIGGKHLGTPIFLDDSLNVLCTTWCQLRSNSRDDSDRHYLMPPGEAGNIVDWLLTTAAPMLDRSGDPVPELGRGRHPSYCRAKAAVVKSRWEHTLSGLQHRIEIAQFNKRLEK